MEINESAKRRRGGQPGNKNAVTHGLYTREGRERFQKVDMLIQDCHALLEHITNGKDISEFKPNNIF